LLALAYGQHYKYLAPRNIILLSIVPLFTLLMVATQNWHHVFYTSISIDPNSNLPIYSYSIWFWLYVMYSYVLLVVGVVVMIRTILSVPNIYKYQILILIIGAVLPFTGNIIYLFKISPLSGLDLTPIAFGFSGLFLTWGILGFKLLNIIPVARHKLVEQMRIGVLTTNSQGIIIDYNPAMQEITGIPAKEAIGQKVIDVLAYWKEFIDCYDVKADKRDEIYFIDKKAKYYYDLQITLLYDRHKRSAGQVITLHDITEKNQTEEALNKSEERFRQIAENAQEWIWEVNADGLYTYASPVVKDILGYDIKEIVGKKYFYDFFPENNREELKTAALSAFTKKLPFTKFENTNIHKNGRIVYLSTSGVPVLDNQGSLVAYRGSDIDITARILADQTLRQSEEKYRTIIENIEDGYFEIDLAGNLTFFNESLQKTSGYSHEELKRLNIRDYMDEENAKKIGGLLNNISKTGKSVHSFSWRVTTKDSKKLILESSFSLIHNANGQPSGFRGIVRNQTDSIKAAEEIKNSEEKYRSLFDNMQNGFALHKIILNKNLAPIDYTFIEVNNAFLEQTGLKREKIIGQKVTKIIPGIEKDPADWIGFYGKVALTGEEIKFEQYSEQLKKWYSVTAYSPKEQHFATIFTDITERKQADELQAVIYQISEAVHSTKDLDMLYKSIHKILEQILDVTNFYIAQYDDETKLLSFPFDVDSEDEFPATARPLGNGITEYMIKTGKPLLLNKNDIEKYKQQGKFEAVGALSEQWMGSPLRIKNKVMGVIAVNSYHDPNLYTKSDLKILTFVAEQVAIAIEQKQSITDLEVEKTYLNELFTSSPEALALVTIDGTVLHINEQFATLFGFKEEDIFGRNIDDLLVPDSHKKIADDYTKKVAVGKRVYFEALRKKKDGSSINVSVLSSPVNYKGDVLAVYAAYRDITDRIRATEIIKKSEEKYRTQSIELSESNSMKEMLLDVIAHDLRNPAGVIKGFAEFGLEMDPKNEILKEIEGGVDNLLNVIGDATTLSKVALGDKIKKEELDLVRIIKIAVDENASQIKLNEMALKMEMDESLKAHANPIICEVFRNYITNAIKYAKAGKKIIIDTVVDGEFVTVNVKDFGETIKLEDRKNIFMRNVQLGKTKGRGLGLAIVKRIAEAHNGEVGVMPNVPKGNIFYIKLPI
jgi:PAS domain S-box-containing protein